MRRREGRVLLSVKKQNTETYPEINPKASGNTNGYTISIDKAASQAQIQGAGCGRTHIKLHLAKRIGSEGCISTIEW